MADIEYRYPPGAGPYTATWTAGCSTEYAQEDDDGVSSSLTAGGRQFAYQIADPTITFVHTVEVPYTSVVEFRAFRDVVLGRTFEMSDPIINEFVEVRFAPDAFGREWTAAQSYDENGDLMFSVTIRLRLQIA